MKRRKEEMSSKEETQTAEKAVDQTTERADAAPADVKEVGLSIHDERDNMAEEAKTVAVKSTQDLISFSLGAPRDGADVEVDAPESMEIKSTKQVAKAVPVETPSDEAEPLIPPSDAMGSMDADEAAARVDEGVHLREVDVPGFHDAEVRADVEAPDVTSDSQAPAWRPFWPVVAPDETLELFFTKSGTAWFQAFDNFSQSVSTRVGRVLIIALGYVSARKDDAVSDRQPLASGSRRGK